MPPASSFLLPALLGYAFTNLVKGQTFNIPLAIPAAIPPFKPANGTFPVADAAAGSLFERSSDLNERDYCNPGTANCGQCSNNGLWCTLDSPCCSNFCASVGSFCCSAGQCLDSQFCCNNDGCIEPADECCLYGGYCPSPFKCYWIPDLGQQTCCTDAACTKYLVDGQTVTYNPNSGQQATSAQLEQSSGGATPTITGGQQSATGAIATAQVGGGVTVWMTYYTTITWNYYSSYYTYTAASAIYPDITSSFTSFTTTLSVGASDSFDASLSLSLASGSNEFLLPGKSPTETSGSNTLGAYGTLRSGGDGSGGSSGGSSGGNTTGGAAMVTMLGGPWGWMVVPLLTSSLGFF